MLGQIKLALDLTEDAIADTVFYAKYLVKQWPFFVQSEAFAQSGDIGRALKLLSEAEPIFVTHDNFQGSLWSLILRSDCLRETSWQEAAEVVRAAWERLGKRHLAHVEARLYLEEAEIARARCDWTGVEQAITKLRNHLDNKVHFTASPPILIAHALLVEAECARQRAQEDTVKLLNLARGAYARIGAKAFVARVDVALSLAGRPKRSDSTLLNICRRKLYQLEVARIEKVKEGFYPIHFL